MKILTQILSDELPDKDNRIMFLNIITNEADEDDLKYEVVIGEKTKNIGIKPYSLPITKAYVQLSKEELRKLYDGLAEIFGQAVSKQTVMDKFLEFTKDLADNL